MNLTKLWNICQDINVNHYDIYEQPYILATKNLEIPLKSNKAYIVRQKC